ncbi:MAG: ATP-dependent DNA ligase, partial [Paracoccaceae bacterium]|nr:ATP-dependent DNA ligase [Paracoccaceae bacterium]
MKDFAALFTRIDESTKTSVKTAALADYFQTATPEDRLWTIALFTGRRPKRTITATRLREWAAEVAGLPEWLFEESYSIVGDLAETIALVLPPPRATSDASLTDWIIHLRALGMQDDDARKAGIIAAWDRLPPAERFLFTKLLTGGLRIGVSAKLMTRALAQATG